MEENGVAPDFAYCPGPHQFPADASRKMRNVLGPFRVRVRVIKERIASRCPICGRAPYPTKEEADADIKQGIRY